MNVRHVGILGLAAGLLLAGDMTALWAQATGIGLAITPVSNAALTAPVRSTYGKVKSIAGREITLDVGSRTMTFIVDENTDVLTRGAARRAGGSLPINYFVRSGDMTRVSYRELDGAMRVSEIQVRDRNEIASR